MQILNTLTLILDKLLVSLQVLLHRLTSLLHLLNSLKLLDKLFILTLEQAHLSVIVFNHRVFFAQFSFKHTCRRL